MDKSDQLKKVELKTITGDLEYICRYCLSGKGLLYIFANNDGARGDNLIELSRKCLNIQINVHDEHPKYICKICLKKLKSCYEFYKQTRRSLTYLRTMKLKCRNQETTHNDDNENRETLGSQITTSIVTANVEDAADDSQIMVDEKIYDADEQLPMICPYCNEWFQNLKIHICRIHFDIDMDEEILELLYKTDKSDGQSIENQTQDELVLSTVDNAYENDNAEQKTKGNIDSEDTKTSKTIPHTQNTLLKKCPFCQDSFRDLTRHIRNRHKFKPDKLNQKDYRYYDESVKLCPYCDKECDNFNMHIHEEHPQVESDDYKLQLRKLKSEETLAGTQTCKICCMSLIHIDKHIKMHPPDKFNLFDKIKKNVENQTVLPTRDYCGLCNTVFDNILEHFHKCHLDIVYCKIPKVTTMKICSVCGLSVTEISKHMMKHNRRRLTCDKCQKTFANKRNVEQHMRIHLNTREFKCNVCPKAFNSPKSLSVHMHSHTGIKRHKCDLCEKRFTESCHLNIHKKVVHEKIYSVQCRFCDKPFFHKSQVTKHETRYHKY